MYYALNSFRFFTYEYTQTNYLVITCYKIRLETSDITLVGYVILTCSAYYLGTKSIVKL